MKKKYIIHPFLSAIYPGFFFISHNIHQISLVQGALLIAIPLAFSILFMTTAKMRSWNAMKTGIILTVFWTLFFTYGNIIDTLARHHLQKLYLHNEMYLLVFWGVLFAGTILFVSGRGKSLNNLTVILNSITVVLVLFPLFHLGIYLFRSHSSNTADRVKYPGKERTFAVSHDSLPDIYYIILDGYAREDVLKETFGLSNHEFISFLQEEGFYVAGGSHSNYSSTMLSLASSLNMEKINYLADLEGTGSRNLNDELIQNSKVMNFLKLKGYTFINFRSGWGPTNDMVYADRQYGNAEYDELIMVLIRTTVLRNFVTSFLNNERRERILNTLADLSKVPLLKEPTFAYAHFNCPHPPFVFGRNGETVPRTIFMMYGSVWTQKKNYVDQLMFLTGKITSLIRTILSHSAIPPIIVLQSDHGPASTFYQEPGYGWNNPTQKMLRERMSILNAYYLPSGGDKLLYDSITPVNSFRVIFNYYFHAGEELVKDESYFSSYKERFQFRDVTGLLKE